jgi:hypothetical protein
MAERVKPLRELLKSQKPGAPIFAHGQSGGTFPSPFMFGFSRADGASKIDQRNNAQHSRILSCFRRRLQH